jgi:hypothetical protein
MALSTKQDILENRKITHSPSFEPPLLEFENDIRKEVDTIHNTNLHPTDCPPDLTEEQCKAMVPPHTGYKKVLVTGGAGFIGSHVAEYLLARGDDVVIIDEMNEYCTCDSMLPVALCMRVLDTFTH